MQIGNTAILMGDLREWKDINSHIVKDNTLKRVLLIKLLLLLIVSMFILSNISCKRTEYLTKDSDYVIIGNYEIKSILYDEGIKGDSAVLYGYVNNLRYKKPVPVKYAFINIYSNNGLINSKLIDSHTSYFKFTLPSGMYCIEAVGCGYTDLITDSIFFEKNHKVFLIFNMGTVMQISFDNKWQKFRYSIKKKIGL